jgi:hypothetical protein
MFQPKKVVQCFKPIYTFTPYIEPENNQDAPTLKTKKPKMLPGVRLLKSIAKKNKIDKPTPKPDIDKITKSLSRILSIL